MVSFNVGETIIEQNTLGSTMVCPHVVCIFRLPSPRVPASWLSVFRPCGGAGGAGEGGDGVEEGRGRAGQADTRDFAQYFIDAGKVTMSVNSVVVHTLDEGEFFGEGAFIATVANLLGDAQREQLMGALGLEGDDMLQALRSSTIKVEQSCRCLELNVKGFLASFKDDFDGLYAAVR